MALRWRGSVDRDPSVGSRWTPLDSDVGSRWTPPFVLLPCGFREAKQHCVSWSTMAKAASRASRSYMASRLSGILVAWLTSTTMATIQGQKTQGFYAVSITQEAQQCASRVQAVVEGCGVSDSAVGWAPWSTVRCSNQHCHLSNHSQACRVTEDAGPDTSGLQALSLSVVESRDVHIARVSGQTRGQLVPDGESGPTSPETSRGDHPTTMTTSHASRLR